MADRNPDKVLIYSVLELLKLLGEEHERGTGDPTLVVDTDSLGVAQECLSAAFGIDLETDRAQLSSVSPAILRTLFKQALQFVPKKPAPAAAKPPAAAPLQDDAPAKDPRFDSYVQLLAKRGYFENLVEGTPEYQEKYLQARKKYDAAQAQKKDAKPLPEGTAEEWKTKGNTFLMSSPPQPREAIEAYNNAILLDPTNAIFFANRAAAHLQLSAWSDAVRDCQEAIRIQPSYIKSYPRLAQAYEAQGMYQEAISEGYEAGLQIEPNNAALQQSLAAAQAKLASRANPFAAAPLSDDGPAQDAPASGFPDLGGLGSLLGGGAGGGMPDLGSLLSDPAKMQQLMSNPMIANMMKDPKMMAMASQMMQNPDMMSQLGNMFGGGPK